MRKDDFTYFKRRVFCARENDGVWYFSRRWADLSKRQALEISAILTSKSFVEPITTSDGIVGFLLPSGLRVAVGK